MPIRPHSLQKRTQFKQKKECCAGRLEGSFLRSLVRLTKAKTVLEVGMFTGTSSLAMAEALPTDGKVNPGCSVSATSHRLVSAVAQVLHPNGLRCRPVCCNSF